MTHEGSNNRGKEESIAAAGPLVDVVRSHRIIVCVGSGGVGKTTTAAAIATRAALEGRRVLCLTIDPARRLANSLGLSEMKADAQEIPASLFRDQGLEPKGSLFAMMLDPKRTFDELVTRHASSAKSRKAILENRIYQYVSSSLAGTQEYMAMEKLYSVREDRRWDLIVLDTPPTTNALDFLDAPERLVEMIDSPAMRWFVGASADKNSLSLAALSKGAAMLLKALGRFTGASFLDEVGSFVTGLNDLFGGFRERASRVSQALRGPDVAFVIVTSPHAMAIREAIFFGHRLRAAGMKREAFVINNVHSMLQEPRGTVEQQLQSLEQVLPSDVDARHALDRLQQAFEDEQANATADRRRVAHLRAQVGDEDVFVEVPALEEDVHELRALAQLSVYLLGSEGTTP